MMADDKRYIEAEQLLRIIGNPTEAFKGESYRNGFDDARIGIIDTIRSLPTADAAEVVRCKDCKYKFEKRTTRNKQLVYQCWRQDGNEFSVHSTDFCSFGRKRLEVEHG